MPAPRQLSAVILARVAALPAAAQAFLAAASVLGQHAPDPRRSRPSPGCLMRQDDVDAAVAAGLLTESASGPSWPSPIRCTGRRFTPISARRAAGNCTRGPLRSWPAGPGWRTGSAASLGPDEALAAELEASARASAAAGDGGASAWALEQAAALSPAAGGPGTPACSMPPLVLLDAADTPAAARVLASCQASSARRDALTGLLGVFTGSPTGRESLAGGLARPTTATTEREIGARAATSLANWMVISGRPDQALTWADRAVGGTVAGSALRAMARTAQAYAFAAAGRSPEGLAAARTFCPPRGTKCATSETDALIMRGMLRVYVDDLPGAIADLGVAAARLRTGLPSTYPGPCLAHLSDAHFRRGDWDAAVTYAQLATSLAQDGDRPAGPGPGTRPGRPGPGLPWPVVCRPSSRERGPGRGRAVPAGGRRWPPRRWRAPRLPRREATWPSVLVATEPVRATGLLGVGGRPGIFNWRAIEADALIGLGRLDEAESALGEFEAAIPAAGLASAALALARCRGNLAVAAGAAARGGERRSPAPTRSGQACRCRSNMPC